VLLYNLQYVMEGGDINDIKANDDLKDIIGQYKEEGLLDDDPFKTPYVNNMWYNDPEFQADSAGVHEF